MTLEEMYGNAKALVEDRTYNIGEISEKTGLQKTANGWVKPKSNKGAKKDASGADVLNNKNYKDGVRTAEGEAKIVSQMDTKGIQRRINELEALKKKNGGELGIYGERELKIKKAELEKRNKGISSNNEHYDDDKVVKEIELRKAAMNGGTKERKALFKFEAENADDEQLKHVLASKNQPADRIEMYKAELEKRNSNSAQEELIKLEKERRSYGDDFDEFYENPYALSKEEKNEAMKNPKTRLSQKYDEVIKSKKGTPQYNTALEEYTKEREFYQNSQGVEALKEFPVIPISKDSDCRITADTKIRLKKN